MTEDKRGYNCHCSLEIKTNSVGGGASLALHKSKFGENDLKFGSRGRPGRPFRPRRIISKLAMAVDREMELEGNNDEIGRPEDDMGISYTLDMFREHDEVRQMLSSIENAVENQFTAEKAFETLKTILDYYQEQPHLLDPHLEGILTQLVEVTRNPNNIPEVASQAFKYLWLFIKVRGYKTIVRKLPHEVKDLLPVLHMLETPEGSSDFYESYVLLLWLSIIVYMPFNMMGFDTTAAVDSQQAGAIVVDRILTVIKTHLRSGQKSREMAAYLASRFITRPDLKDKYLPEFVNYCFEVLENDLQEDVHSVFHKLGVLRAMGLIFKHGKREELFPYSQDVLSRLLACQVTTSCDAPVRKLAMKLIQRIGLTFLKPRVASWRYQRGSRSLAMNVQGAASESLAVSETLPEDDEEVAGEIEEVIDNLLQGLKDKDTIVRWSAAKGVGRVTSRLPREFGDEVVGAILELFSSRESDKAWHGGCLALAELARRGLLLPERLPAVAPVIDKALVYDELRGQCSVGSNIRDAACYLCWAFARAYHPDQMAPYVEQLATGLLIVSLFDREIPCRRAASAAFQEHVGRQGTFPHGIELHTMVDYFAVGNRSNSFLTLSVKVGRHPEYTRALIDHLVDRKVNHWDSAIRELAAKALHNLTHLAPEYMSKTVAPRLLHQTTSSILVTRHGCILALANITHALSLVASKEGKAWKDIMGQDILDGIAKIVATLEERKLYRGMGGEYMKQATSVMIEKCSLAAIPFHGQEVLDQWHNLLEECMIYVDENIRAAALEALPPLWTTYFEPTTEEKLKWRDELIKRYTHALHTDKEIHSLGFAAALGCLTHSLVVGKFDIVLEGLINATKITPGTTNWAQTRKEAINSIFRLVKTVGIKKDGKACEHVCQSNLPSIYHALLNSLDDYTMDRRGDIGAWVREAAISSLQALTLAVVAEDASLLTEDIVKELMSRICQQAVERIDRTRKVAGTAFAALLYSSPEVPFIPDRQEVKRVFPKPICDTVNWASEKATFHLFIQIVDFPAYRTRVLLGITYSAGGISANLSRYTSEAIHSYLNARAKKPEFLSSFLETILQLFISHQKVDRITLPLIKTVGDLLSSSAVLDPILGDDDAYTSRLITVLKKECFRSTDYHKLAAVITALCELLRMNSSAAKSCLTQLVLFLGYQYPKVRTVTATSLLTAVQDYCDQGVVPEEHIEEITSILEETEWMDNIEEVRKQRNRLFSANEINEGNNKIFDRLFKDV
ncbi:tubulin-specific chaperone D isoform X2 [Procambarus clarkii]|uniref:tubulin-specific chaperone D isoform X2 n=1 Tax=Procambarus clarkii TaxID=6728 RepID=UPI00374450FF